MYIPYFHHISLNLLEQFSNLQSSYSHRHVYANIANRN